MMKRLNQLLEDLVLPQGNPVKDETPTTPLEEYSNYGTIDGYELTLEDVLAWAEYEEERAARAIQAACEQELRLLNNPDFHADL